MDLPTINQLPPLPELPFDAHKGQCGRVLVIAGSIGMSGAGSMASRAALRCGAGVVLWAVAKSLNNVAEAMSPEVMTLPLPETNMGAPAMEVREILVEAARECDCVLLGPGLPVAGETGELMRLLIPEIFPTLVLDGGALTAIGDDMMILRKRQSPTIITPHPGEMGRLTKKTASDVQAKRNDFAVKYAKLSGAVVALKGANTLVTNGTEVYENKTGNPGMATAGSGDVLGGVIAAMVGLGLEPFAAAKLGVFLHGYAGDLVRSEKGMRGLVASDMIDKLPRALLDYEAAKK